MSSNLRKSWSKRAGNNCYRKKVKCVAKSTTTCKRRCLASLTCTYKQYSQKRGPKGGNTKVLSELRETERNAQLAAGSSTNSGFNRRSLSATPDPTQGLLPPGLISRCIEYFSKNVYSSEPVLHPQRAQEAANNMGRSIESYCMIVALCAYVMIKFNYELPAEVLSPKIAHMPNVHVGQILLEESLRVRQGYGYRKNPTHTTVLTSWFYSGCYFELEQEKVSWTHHRDAATYAELLGMHKDEIYEWYPLDAPQRRVLYCLLIIADRFYALHEYRSIALHHNVQLPPKDKPSTGLPIAAEIEPILVLAYLTDYLILHWNTADEELSLDVKFMRSLQETFSQNTFLRCSITKYKYDEAQKVKIFITRQWLRVKTWQLMSRNQHSACQDSIEAYGDFLETSKGFSTQSMAVHGLSLTKKLIEIADYLTDMATRKTSSLNSLVPSPRPSVRKFIDLISELRGAESQTTALLAKLSEGRNYGLPDANNSP